MARGGRVFRIALAFSLLPILVVKGHAELEFQPLVSVGVMRADNVTLAMQDEQAETISQLITALVVTQDSARLTTNTALRIEGYHYRDRSDSNVFEFLDSNSRLALDPENLFLEFGASRSQSIVDPTGALPRLRRIPISTNRTDRDAAYVGPAFQYGLGTNVIVSGSYRRGWTRFEESTSPRAVPNQFFREADDDTLTFSVDNYSSQRGASWALRYDAQKTDYGVFEPWEYRKAIVELGGWVGDGLRLFVAGGKESAWDAPFDPSLEDTLWEAGFSKSVGEQFDAEFAFGERTFGPSRRGVLNFSFRRGQMLLSYTEQPTTQSRNPYSRGGLFRLDEPDDFLSGAGRGERYLSKRFQWIASLELRRTRFSLTVFDETREDRRRIDGTPLDGESQSGGFFNVSWRVGARTGFSFELQRVLREFMLGQERDFRSATVGANYDLGPRTTLSLEYERSEEETVPRAVRREYRLDLISLLLTRTF